jgi:putative N6-adenine-specific DNA methylase
LRTRFIGWRVGIVTNDPDLAGACALPFAAPFGPVSHGGLRVWLYTTAPLPA